MFGIGTRGALGALAIGMGFIATGCGDARVEALSQGIGRDSALAIINQGATGDSLARVYRQETYINEGRMINVLLYHKDGVKQEQDSTVARSALTPIVLVDGRVTGWGWTHYDSVAQTNNFAQPQR